MMSRAEVALKKRQSSSVPHLRPVPEVEEPEAGKAAEVISPRRRKGLCVNCAHRETCALPVYEGAVWYCEQYELAVPAERRLRVVPSGEGTRTPPAAKPIPPERTKGLCVNCAHRETCTFPVPEGGVWHCEEYE